MKQLTIKEAENLMHQYLKKNPVKIKHSILVSKFAYQTAKKIKKKHPSLNIDLKEIRILGLLHDIGRGVRDEWIYHAFEGAKLLRELGYHSYADKIEKHDPTQEVAKYLGIKGDFLPSLIEEKILIYADLHYSKDKFVNPKKRLDKETATRIEEKYPGLLEFFKEFRKRKSKIIKEIKQLMG